mmetsp:Transcript_30562/g.59633  ORF Transcript_30562/g.59633 Transcript_30562/m.59633 type:complete len:383 (+) Transcript_30562:2430-3578(+)
MFDQFDRELVVDEDLENCAVLQTDEKSFPCSWASHHSDVSDDSFEYPFPDFVSLEVEQLQSTFLAQNDVHGCDHQQVAIKLPDDFFLESVMHIMRHFWMDSLVHQNAIRQLNSQTSSVHRNLLHVISGLDAHLLLSDEVLNDHIRHCVSVGVAVLVQAMHSREDGLVHPHHAIVATDGQELLFRPSLDTPHPVLPFRNYITQEVTFPCVHRHFPVRPSTQDVFAIAVVAQTTGVIAQLSVLAVLLSRQAIEGHGLVPTANSKKIHRISVDRAPLKTPNWFTSLDFHLFTTFLVSDADSAVELPKSQVLTIVCPAGAQDLRGDLELLNRFLLWGPHAKIRYCGTCQLLGDGVVGETLDGLVVAVLEDTFTFAGPDNDCFVRTS